MRAGSRSCKWIRTHLDDATCGHCALRAKYRHAKAGCVATESISKPFRKAIRYDSSGDKPLHDAVKKDIPAVTIWIGCKCHMRRPP